MVWGGWCDQLNDAYSEQWAGGSGSAQRRESGAGAGASAAAAARERERERTALTYRDKQRLATRKGARDVSPDRQTDDPLLRLTTEGRKQVRL